MQERSGIVNLIKMKKATKKPVAKKSLTKAQSGTVVKSTKKTGCTAKPPRGQQYSDMTYLYTWNSKKCAYDSKKL